MHPLYGRLISMSQKLLKKLVDKKYREETGLFLVEGKKSIEELLTSDFEIDTVYATLETLSDIEAAVRTYHARMGGSMPEVICVTEEKLAATGTFRSNNAGIAIAHQKTPASPEHILTEATKSLVLVLDDVRDPGNLGTIIRTADWFGITHIVTSLTTTDFYNPKVIAATMGSFTRVSVTPLPLPSFLKQVRDQGILTFGAFLDGENIFEMKQPQSGMLVMGSESHGISDEIAPFIAQRVTIPQYGKAESLNVAIATAVILSAFKR
jgi:RNA methyltransferase, TrmH family